jgi:hypothetical protein
LVSLALLAIPRVWADGVVTVCTEAALRMAMAGGGTVRFACDGTITLASTITIATHTVVDATGHQVTLSGGHAVRVFYVNSNVTLVLVNLTMVDGSSPEGGAIFNQGEVALQNCAFAGNNAVGAAGIDGWPPTPGTNGCGGAIYNVGTVRASFSAFLGNVASGGGAGGAGGIGILSNPWAGLVGIPGREGGDARGGAVFNSGLAVVNASAFIGNQARGGTGGAGGQGPPGGDLGMPGGYGGVGGGGFGAALFNEGGVVQWVNCTAVSNLCAGGSGGRGGEGGDAMDPTHGRGGWGGMGGAGGSGFGAIYADALCGLTNCTVAFNTAIPGNGGGGGNGGSGRVPGPPGADGTAGTAGGGIKSTGCHLTNTLLATNTPGGNCIGTINDAGHNLSSDGTCAFTNTGSLNNTDPKLAALADNGGPTLTMALLPGSPAIDAGDTAAAPPTDQRGQPRPVGPAADIGAYEYGCTPRLRISPPQAGGVDIFLCDVIGQSCRLLTSTNLTDWLPMATNQISPDGTTLFQVNVGTSERQRFYRVTFP